MRELAVGDWKILQIPAVGNPLPATPPAEGEVRGGFFVPESGEVIEVEGIVTARSTVPRPGTVPYKDQIFSVHLSEIIGGKTPTQSQAVVYLFGMVDNRLTPLLVEDRRSCAAKITPVD